MWLTLKLYIKNTSEICGGDRWTARKKGLAEKLDLHSNF